MPVTNQAFTLTPILNAVNDADTVFIKMTVSGSTGGINSARIDNVQFNASPVPEPATAVAILASLGLIAIRRPRIRLDHQVANSVDRQEKQVAGEVIVRGAICSVKLSALQYDRRPVRRRWPPKR